MTREERAVPQDPIGELVSTEKYKNVGQNPPKESIDISSTARKEKFGPENGDTLIFIFGGNGSREDVNPADHEIYAMFCRLLESMNIGSVLYTYNTDFVTGNAKTTLDNINAVTSDVKDEIQNIIQVRATEGKGVPKTALIGVSLGVPIAALAAKERENAFLGMIVPAVKVEDNKVSDEGRPFNTSIPDLTLIVDDLPLDTFTAMFYGYHDQYFSKDVEERLRDTLESHNFSNLYIIDDPIDEAKFSYPFPGGIHSYIAAKTLMDPDSPNDPNTILRLLAKWESQTTA